MGRGMTAGRTAPEPPRSDAMWTRGLPGGFHAPSRRHVAAWGARATWTDDGWMDEVARGTLSSSGGGRGRGARGAERGARQHPRRHVRPPRAAGRCGRGADEGLPAARAADDATDAPAGRLRHHHAGGTVDGGAPTPDASALLGQACERPLLHPACGWRPHRAARLAPAPGWRG
eukprot:scaffold916_cov516-Prasinococcus_capsulatus_cf.AAC.9